MWRAQNRRRSGPAARGSAEEAADEPPAGGLPRTRDGLVGSLLNLGDVAGAALEAGNGRGSRPRRRRGRAGWIAELLGGERSDPAEAVVRIPARSGARSRACARESVLTEVPRLAGMNGTAAEIAES